MTTFAIIIISIVALALALGIHFERESHRFWKEQEDAYGRRARLHSDTRTTPLRSRNNTNRFGAASNRDAA